MRATRLRDIDDQFTIRGSQAIVYSLHRIALPRLLEWAMSHSVGLGDAQSSGVHN